MASWAISRTFETLALAAVFLTACSPAPAPAPTAKTDPVTEPWYGETIEQLARMNLEAATLVRGGKADKAAALITKGQPLANRVLAVPRPTLAAMEAASDLDELYGRMLLSNRNYGWARLEFQKNSTRWKNWKPATPETVRRLRQADFAIAECDRRMSE